MSKTVKRWIVFAVINLSLLSLWPLSRLYLRMLAYPAVMAATGCAFSRVLHLYCPGCGGTRAAFSLLRFDFVSAFIYNPIVPVTAALFLCFDIYAAVAIARKKEKVLRLNPRMLYVYLGFVAAVFIIRNLLLCLFGIDLIGDLAKYWV